MKTMSNASAFKPLAKQTDTQKGKNGQMPNHGMLSKGVKCLKKQHMGHDGDGH